MATKSIVDQKIADAISALKADQAWIKSSGGSSGGTTPGGEFLSTNGDLELSIEKAVDSELWVNDQQGQTFFLNVKNKGTSGTYYRINANFDLVEGANVAINTATLTVGNSSMVNFTPNTTFGATPISGMSFSSTAGSGSGTKIWIGKNTDVSLVLVLTMHYNAPTTPNKLWTWDFSIRQIN